MVAPLLTRLAPLADRVHSQPHQKEMQHAPRCNALLGGIYKRTPAHRVFHLAMGPTRGPRAAPTQPRGLKGAVGADVYNAEACESINGGHHTILNTFCTLDCVVAANAPFTNNFAWELYAFVTCRGCGWPAKSACVADDHP